MTDMITCNSVQVILIADPSPPNLCSITFLFFAINFSSLHVMAKQAESSFMSEDQSLVCLNVHHNSHITGDRPSHTQHSLFMLSFEQALNTGRFYLSTFFIGLEKKKSQKKASRKKPHWPRRYWRRIQRSRRYQKII